VTSPSVNLLVIGTPVPQGSTRAFVVAGRAVTTAANPRTRPWKAAVAAVAAEARPEDWPMLSPIEVRARFAFTRPAAHYGSGRNAGRLRPSAPTHKVSVPDVDKLLRAVLDALTGVLFVDDRQVVAVDASKGFGEVAGAWVRVTALELHEGVR
jgi:crossover junction endodeoxyribonuclease RusA